MFNFDSIRQPSAPIHRALILFLILAACALFSGAARAEPKRGSAMSAQEQLRIVGFAFVPESITVPVGTTLTWTNMDGAPHTVTAEGDDFASGTLSQGETFSHTFSKAGTINYLCTIHPSMKASITVVEETTGAAQTLYLPFVAAANALQNATSTPTATATSAQSTPTESATGSPTATPTASPSPTKTPAPEETPTALLRWSDPATWDGSLPQEGAEVLIPVGKVVLLDISPPPLQSLNIEGELHFADVDLNLTTGWIMVNGGKLQAGTPAKRYTNRAIITLTGVGGDVMGMGDKVLGVRGGQLRLFGEERTSWVRLDATAHKGATKIALDEAPIWRVGDKIVIASTDFDSEQAEERTITAISGTQVSIDKPLAYMHWGERQSFDGHMIDERAEVGLLSRNILIQGDVDSESDGLGGHTMYMNGAKIELDGVEFFRMGRRGKLARYPVHFHLMGDGARGSSIKNLSIHHSFNRCITIHGSHGVLVQSNVAYYAAGHCFFLEDGLEEDNLFQGNLGVDIRKPESADALLFSDTFYLGPAVYWITNPANRFVNNVAAGSSGTGFWVALPQHPTGPSQTESIWPRRMAFTEFSGNVSHSNGTSGLHVDSGPNGDEDGGIETTYYAAYADPTDTGSEIVTVTFTNFTAYKNRGNGVWLRGEEHRLDGATLADNSVGATFASDTSYARNSVFIGETANVGQPEQWQIDQGDVGEGGRSLPLPWEKEFAIRGFEFYDGKVGVEQSYFAGFAPNSFREGAALSYLDYTDFSVSPFNFVRALSFAADTKRIYLATRPAPATPSEGSEDGYRSSIFLDVDGSVTGKANHFVVVNNPFMYTESCTQQSEWNVWLCPETYVSLNIRIENPELNSVVLTREGHPHTLFGSGSAPGTYFRSIVLAQSEETLTFDDHIPSKFDLILREGAGQWLLVKIPYPDKMAKVSRYGEELATKSDMAELQASTRSAFYHDYAAETLYIKLAADEQYEALTVEENGPVPPSPGNGVGLTGSYFNNLDFAGTAQTRVDKSINFVWEEAPIAGFPADEFSVRWQGQVEAPEDGSYTFFTVADDNIRLWVCDQQLVDHWDGYDPNPHSGTISLSAGQRCAIRIDFRDYSQRAMAQLWWSYGSYSRHIVPQTQLYP